MNPVTLVNICSERNESRDLAFLNNCNPGVVERLGKLMSGGKIVCLQQYKDILSVPGNDSGGPDERTTYIIGEEQMTSLFKSEASRIIQVKIHNENTGKGKTVSTPRLEGWTEVSRELVWGVENGEAPRNCSIIDLRKDESFVPSPDGHAGQSPLERPAVSVIISTYNQPEWLEKTLWGYSVQDNMDFELIIADDGSRKATYDKVEELRNALPYPVKHVWIEDAGFRKCTVLNKAIEAAAADYVLFSDGDCIPRSDFTDTHIKNRRPGRFLSNGYYKLSMETSDAITKDDIISKRCFDIGWLLSHGLKKSHKNSKLTARGFKAKFLNTFTPAGATWNGHGASGWLSDILNANGFDERMKYGGEDRELGERLENAKIKGVQHRYSTVCLHLDHSRGYVNEEDLALNRSIRKSTKSNKTTRTPYGIIKEY